MQKVGYMVLYRSLSIAILTILCVTGCQGTTSTYPAGVQDNAPEIPALFSVEYDYPKEPHPIDLFVDLMIRGLAEGDVATVHAVSPQTEIVGNIDNGSFYEFPLPEYNNVYSLYISVPGYTITPTKYTVEVIDKVIYIVEGEVREVYSQPLVFELTAIR